MADYFQKRGISFREKKPFAARANPRIDQNSPEFLDMEKYFMQLLRQTQYTIEEILENTFEEYEIKIFQPMSTSPEMNQLQNSNTLRFRNLLQTRFKGRVSTLQLKMAMLYFGLPVAPMKPGAFQMPVPTDLDFGEDGTVFRPDPLQFLDNYTERTYGDSSKRVNSTHFFQTPPTQVFESLKLRGGGKVEEVGEEGEEGGVNYFWSSEFDPVHDAGLCIYGYQGLRLVGNGYYGLFMQAVDHLLGSRYGFDYNVRLQAWHQPKKGEEYEVADEVTGTIFHGKQPDADTDPIRLFLKKWAGTDELVRAYRIFVTYDQEDKPSYFEPWERDTINLSTRKFIKDATGRWWADSKSGYMRVPGAARETYKCNQLIDQYEKIFDSLYPEQPHQYIYFWDSDESKLGVSYGNLDPPPGFWEQLLNQLIYGDINDDEIFFHAVPIPSDYIPVVVPGFHDYTTDFSSGSAFTLEDLSIRDTADDYKTINKLADAVYQAYPELKGRNDEDMALEVWIPGLDFMNTNIPGQRINIQRDDISVAPADWRLIVHNFRRLRLHSNKDKLSIVVRPIWDNYVVNVPTTGKWFDGDINHMTLAEFKEQVKTILPTYKGGQKGEVLCIRQVNFGTNENDFAITHDTDEDGWKLITRRITEVDIDISVEQWDSDEPINESSEFGPKYRHGRRLTTYYEDPAKPKPKPFSEPVNKLFERSENNLDGIARSAMLRDRLFRTDPSIFTNPLKPAIPLQAPPIETIISTGPNVPAFTTAVRTPTEMARLEKEVHRLRGNLLARIRECPYMDCKRYFPYADGEGLARHMREDHAILQCFLCPADATRVPQFDSFTIRQHFLDDHYDEIQAFFGVPPTTNNGGARYCSRCARDLWRLNDPADKAHHEALCQVTDKPNDVTYCIFCGAERNKDHEPCGCGITPNHSSNVGSFCDKCGIEYTANMSQAYREVHRRLCQRPGGQPNDFCPKCDVELTELNAPQKQRHIDACRANGGGGSGGGGNGGGGDPGDEEDEEYDDPVALGKSAVATGQPRRRGARRSSRNTPVLDAVLAAIGDSDLRRMHKAARSSKKKEKKLSAKSPSLKERFREPSVLDRGLEGRRREGSPDYVEWLGEPKEPYGFLPEPQWRCSRCFRCAGFDMSQIEWHMEENGSCRIRRGLGTTEDVPMPNRSGWIATPYEKFDFHKAYFAFVNKYPKYAHTMFPSRPESVDTVWREPYTMDNSIGDFQDDPNYFIVNSEDDAVRDKFLPWPPYEGIWVPKDNEDSDEEPKSVGLSWFAESEGVSEKDYYKRRLAEIPLQERFLPPSDDDTERTPYTELSSGEPLSARNVTFTELSSRTPATTETPRTPFTELSSDPSSASDLSDSPSTSSGSDSEIVDVVETHEAELTPTSSSAASSSIVTRPRSWDPEVPSETRSERRKRKRREAFDPTFEAAAATASDPEEEFSEVGAAPDPVTNLDPDAPRTPRARPKKKSKKSSAKVNRPANLETPFRPFSDDLPVFGLPSAKVAQGLRLTSAGRDTASVSTPLTSYTVPSGTSPAGDKPSKFFRAGSMPPTSAKSPFATATRPSTSQSATTGRSSWSGVKSARRTGA